MANATEALKDAEIALRDFVGDVLEEKFGEKWIENCGVTVERIEKWKERKEEERRRRPSGYTDERLLYYSDLCDLKTIIHKNWELFQGAFKTKKTMEIYLDKLELYRNPDAHHREYLTHEAELVRGIGGEIRAMISAYRRNKSEDAEYFPTIEYVRDSLGNVVRYNPKDISCHLSQILRPGDTIEFVVKAWDPLDEPLQYQIGRRFSETEWTMNNTFTWEVDEVDIGKSAAINIAIRSRREWHAYGLYDQSLILYYTVLPKEKAR